MVPVSISLFLWSFGAICLLKKMGITLEGMWIVLRAQIYYSDKLYFTILPLVIVSQKQVISKLPMSSMGYYAGKLTENAVYCFNEACVALTTSWLSHFSL